MIEQTIVDGKKATVSWLTFNFEPADKESADMARVLYEDGSSAFLTLAKEKPDPIEPQWETGDAFEEGGDV